MSTTAVDAAQALKKLNMRTGGIDKWLSEAEVALIEAATGKVALAGVITTPGPATEVVFTMVFPYELQIGEDIWLQFDVDGEVHTAYAEATNGVRRASDVLAEVLGEIGLAGTNVNATSEGGADISEVVCTIKSNVNLTITDLIIGTPAP